MKWPLHLLKRSRKDITITGFNKELVNIQTLNKTPDLSGYKKLALRGSSSIIGALPSLMGAKILSGSYRVIMPAGVSGELMKYGDGLWGTPVRNGGRIVGHAGLRAANPAAAVLGIFTAVTFITGQYFMSVINTSLEELKSDMDYFKTILMEGKKSETISQFLFLINVHDNYTSIISNQDHRIATLTNVQHASMVMLENMIFYENVIKKQKEKIVSQEKIETVEKDSKEVLENISQWRLCNDGFFLSRILEVILSRNYDSRFLENIKEELNERIKFYDNSLIVITGEICDAILNSKAAKKHLGDRFINLFNPSYRPGKEIKADEYSNVVRNTANIIKKNKDNLVQSRSGIDALLEINDNGMDLMYVDGDVYIKK